jgi:translation initiation factor eIF-2B subunit delta
MDKLFEEILNDNTSGSGTVLNAVIFQLQDKLQKSGNVDLLLLSDKLEKVFEKFPNFALLHHFIYRYKQTFENRKEAPVEDVQNFLRFYLEKYAGAQLKVSEKFLKEINVEGKNILLHSNSSAVKNLFETLKRNKIFPSVWQTVSSPANEGKVQAEFLLNLGYEINLFHEDSISLFAKEIDIAVFGADMIFNGFFVNKTGTYPLCLMMKRLGKPVYVIAEERKKIDEKKTGTPEIEKLLNEYPKPAEELAGAVNGKIKVHNYYFEKIPLSLVDKLFI